MLSGLKNIYFFGFKQELGHKVEVEDVIFCATFNKFLANFLTIVGKELFDTILKVIQFYPDIKKSNSQIQNIRIHLINKRFLNLDKLFLIDRRSQFLYKLLVSELLCWAKNIIDDNFYTFFWFFRKSSLNYLRHVFNCQRLFEFNVLLVVLRCIFV